MSTISAPLSRHERRVLASGTTHQALLLCGIGAAFFYVVADVVGAMNWRGYDAATQTLGELYAIDAPSRMVTVPLLLISGLFTIAFAIGAREVAGANRALRITGNCVLAVGVLGLALPFFPIHLRGLTPTTSDSMHVVLATAQTLLVLVAVAAAAAVRDSWPRFFCLVVISLIVIFGVVSALQAPLVAANLATPWLGVTERMAVYAYMAWLVVTSIYLVRAQRPADY